MGTNRSGRSELMASHTSVPWLAEGLDYRVYRDQLPKRELAFATASFLPVRWNEDSAQTNLYLIVGGGGSRQNQQTSGSSLAAFELDRETRKFYGSIYCEALGIGTSEPIQLQRLTGGFAPYLADMDGIHTWLLIQIENQILNPNQTASTDVTPLLRITYNNALFQFGASFSGTWQFDWTIEI